MTIEGQCTLLGTSGSAGIPVIGCDCEVCRSPDPHNSRHRPAALLHVGGRVIVVDVGPDFRQQALNFHLDHLDGVILTHVHYDHTGGLDDLRPYYFQTRQAVPCLASIHSINDLQARLYYLFEPNSHGKSPKAQLEFHPLYEERGVVDFLGLNIGFMTYEQGGTPVNGFRFGDFAYISDIKEYPDTIFEDLEGVRVLVLSALRWTESFLHFNVDEAVAFAQRVGAERTWLTHIAHELDHRKTNEKLPAGIRLGYDGLTFAFNA